MPCLQICTDRTASLGETSPCPAACMQTRGGAQPSQHCQRPQAAQTLRGRVCVGKRKHRGGGGKPTPLYALPTLACAEGSRAAHRLFRFGCARPAICMHTALKHTVCV
eukprot:360121-Chlamydomonas_euryale.AAC.15